MASNLVLVVDDERDFRLISRHVLERGGYRVIEAADGGEALAQFEKGKPDLILLDGHLPDMDGFEVCRRIRATPGGAKLPIMLCTVRSALETVAEGLEAGATSYILKPFDMEEMLERIAAALKNADPST